MKFSRTWAMPTKDTFDAKPVKEFVQKYLQASKVSIDPFARNKDWFTYTNDLNPDTRAQYHLDAREFLNLMAAKNITADLLIVDPPWTCRQISECYKGFGMPVTKETTQIGKLYKEVRNAAMPLLADDAVVLSFGYNSNRMGKKRGFEIVEIMLVNQGGPHQDIICLAERRLPSGLDAAIKV